jgi:hypothetical protein
MAEFCEKCLVKYMGLESESHPEWLVNNGGICEGCGYEYLKRKKKEKKKNKKLVVVK